MKISGYLTVLLTVKTILGSYGKHDLENNPSGPASSDSGFEWRSSLVRENEPWCLDPWYYSPYSKKLSNALVKTTACNGSSSQKWVMDDMGFIRNQNMCLEKVAKKLKLNECDPENSSMKWLYSSDGTIRWVNNALYAISINKKFASLPWLEKASASVGISKIAKRDAEPNEKWSIFHDCEYKVIWDMEMDGYPQDISWRFMKDSTLVDSGSDYDIQFESYHHEWCVPKDSCFVFEINDSFGDGFIQGGYVLQVNYSEVMKYEKDSGMDSGKTVEFGICTQTPSEYPTLSPQYPTLSPHYPTHSPTPNHNHEDSTFSITLMNMGSPSVNDDLFMKAKNRWEQVVTGDLPFQTHSNDVNHDWFEGFFNKTNVNIDIDDVLIGYSFSKIDGNHGILGRAGPTYVRKDTTTVLSGVMIFDEDDFATMTPEDKLIVIMHEMGHVLGIGTLWSNFKCGTECQDGSVEYSCTEARDEYEHYPYKTGTLAIEKTVCAHWTEENFFHESSSELMTPIFEKDKYQPLSRVSVASLKDLGYEVDVSMADPWNSPNDSKKRLLNGNLGSGDILVPSKTFVLGENDIIRPVIKIFE